MPTPPPPDPDESTAPSPAAAPGSFAARLKKTYGAGADPEVSLDEGLDVAGAKSAASSAFTDELVKRLAQHGLKESRYKLEGEVARGGMGAILRVWDEDLRRHLAMKVILGRVASPSEAGTPPVDSRQLARFLEEAQVTGQLDHPGIVPVHELGLDQDGRVYFTMKLVKGRDLKRIFDLVAEKKEGWNETRALSVILKACEAMAYAHAKGVIHRDLKPANIMVGHYGEVYVMDWGLARVLGRKDAHDIRLNPASITSLASVKTERREEREEMPDSPIVTMDGDVMGTPVYMPPEQARGEVEMLSPRSDVYSIGAMLYQLLARQMPYVSPRMRVSNRTVLALVIQGPPAPLHALRKDVPAELAAICEKAMAREPETRYADTLALAEDLRAFLEHRVVHAYETGAVAELKKWVARNKPLAAACAAAILILIAGLIATSTLFATANEERARADAQAIEARHNAELATAKADDVLSLSAIQDLEDLIDRADDLWPAHPENIAKYEEWLNDARALIEGRPSDPAKGTKKKLSLSEHEEKLAELEKRALPQTKEEEAAERAAHPRAEELAKKRAHRDWMARMLGRSPWPSAVEVEAELARSSLPSDATSLNNLAYPLVDPDKDVHGSEAKALPLARRGVAGAKTEDRPAFRDTLAWALFANGRFEEALAEERKALEETSETRREEFKGYLAKLERAVETWKSSSGEILPAREKEWSDLVREVEELERIVAERRAWTFADGEDRWWHAQLTKLIADLESFADPGTGLFSTGISKEHGWGIERRVEFARTIAERSLNGPDAKKRWEKAIASIADVKHCPKYAGLVLTPQLGLLPIGRDAESGLLEFAHLLTGEAAERRADGKLALKESTGLVFVLIPGGTFKMGAQSIDATEPNYDPQAQTDESPVHDVTLAPYFLSKYEMTQGQWVRFTGSNPSQYGPHNYILDWNAGQRPADLVHPVEDVSWTDCASTSARLGLVLPTEAQWERAARSGTDTPWWTGTQSESLAGAANVSDKYGINHFNQVSVWDENLDDGATVHMAVGSYRANPFGLHDVHGNVFEWCRDGYGLYDVPVRASDGERLVSKPLYRVDRGGDFIHTTADARSGRRFFTLPEHHYNSVGLRPARAITP